MHATLPLLKQSDFPALTRRNLETLQVNMGYRCNQQCLHCHVAAGPHRKEMMERGTVDAVLGFLERNGVTNLDLTGGAPEMNPNFRYLVERASAIELKVMDRCNLTVLEEPDQSGLAQFLAQHGVEVIASLPCYLQENVNRQRGKGVFERSLLALKRLNRLGYGEPDSKLQLNLVYNPNGPNLPPAQEALEADYKRELAERYGIRFNHLLVLSNMPIERFGSSLISNGQFENYMRLLKGAYCAHNLEQVMCRSMLSVDWRGYLYDCDFNQMLGLPMRVNGSPSTHIAAMDGGRLKGNSIAVADHCYGCTAGQGSSCGGALA